MPTDRVLIEIQTIANTSGIAKAQAGMLGLSASTLLLSAAIAGVVFVGKSALDNYESLDKAQKNLAQAYGKTGIHLQNAFNAWATMNKRFISDQYDAEVALASFVRAGSGQREALRLLGDALDITAIKGGTMTENAKMLTLALNGNSRGLRFLGISTADYNAIMKSHLTTAQKHHALLKLIEQKTKDGRKAVTDLKQSQNDLNKDWQDFTTRIGPGVSKGIQEITAAADTLVQLLDLAAQYLQIIGSRNMSVPAAVANTTGNLKTRLPAGWQNGSAPAPTGGHGVIHVHGAVTVVTPAAHAKVLGDALRRQDRSLR